MKGYIDILMVAVIIIYIVDLSGFTESWRSLVADLLGVKALKPLPPFDCGQCMTWWVCLIYAAITHHLTLGMTAFIAVLSFLSVPIGQFLLFIKEALTLLSDTLIALCSPRN